MIYGRVETPEGKFYGDYAFFTREVYREAKEFCKIQGMKMKQIRATSASIVMDVAKDFRLPTTKKEEK